MNEISLTTYNLIRQTELKHQVYQTSNLRLSQNKKSLELFINKLYL